jgi:geranylgeranyl diphosphate synthase, type II
MLLRIASVARRYDTVYPINVLVRDRRFALSCGSAVEATRPTTDMDLATYLKAQSERTTSWLDRLVPAETETPGEVHRAMRYSLFAGGKRLRPVLCMAAGEVFGAAESEIMPVACALEMIHTYSLVHDDLPAMDDDDLRRGRPTCHRVFGEAVAILAGDALLTHAFQVLAERGVTEENRARRMRVVAEIARAGGSAGGMIGGQVLDMLSEGKPLDGASLDALHAAKTGALLTASVVAGALSGGADDEALATLRRFGASTGLAFQIADDVLDVTATSADLGKTPGKDASAGKATYPSLYGVEESRRRAERLVADALDALGSLGRPADRLREIARFVVERRN